MRTRIVPACALVLSLTAVMSVAPRAAADDKAAVSAGADEVALKNGGLIRGTVVSVEPGTSVVILEAGVKQPRTIAWAEVADVERGKYAPPPAPNAGYPNAPVPPPPPPPADQAAPPPPAGVGVVRLHIDSPEPVRVFQNRIVAQGAINGYGFVASRTDFVCAAPCDKVVDARDGGQFVVTGEMPAASFRLDDQQGDVAAHVTPGSRGLRAGGWVATGLGIGGMVAGGVLILTGAIQNSTNASSAQILGEKPPAETSSLVPIGGAVLGGSTALLVGGIVMIVVGRTGVDVGPRAAAKQGSAEPRTPRYWMGEF